MVTVAAPASALPLYAVDAPGALLWPLREEEDANADVQGLRQVLADPRRSAVAVGMGAGLREATRQQVLTVLASGKAVVLDAEALTCFAADPAPLLAALHAPTRGPVVMTPHAGEFARLFAPLGIGRQAGEAHWQQALAAARLCRAVVVLKGADTVIADPRGEVVLSSMAPPTLATAGAGDVLAGLVVGELAQGLDAFSAACAAVWHHSLWARRADQARGRALLAEDLLAFGSEDLGGPYAS